MLISLMAIKADVFWCAHTSPEEHSGRFDFHSHVL